MHVLHIDDRKMLCTNDGDTVIFRNESEFFRYIEDKLGIDFVNCFVPLEDTTSSDLQNLYEDLCTVQNEIDDYYGLNRKSPIIKYKLANKFFSVVQPLIEFIEGIIDI